MALRLRKFSRSTALAVKFTRELEKRRALTAARLAESPAPGEQPPCTPPTVDAPPAKPPRHWHDVSEDAQGLLELARNSSPLLLSLTFFSTLALLAAMLQWGPVATFFCSFVALLPLAMLLGDLTESLADWCGPVLGGLLNATLGNATEAIVLVQAVRHGLVGVEQAALLGGVLSNMLLVVGLSFAVSKAQRFNKRIAVADIGVLFVACVAIILPTLAAAAPGGSERATMDDSRSTAFVLLAMYVCFLIYTLSPPADEGGYGDAEQGTPLIGSNADDDEEQPSTPSLSLWSIMGLLTAITVLMALLANSLVTNVFPVSDALGITPDLVSCVFLPIIGNAAELATAVIAARRGAMDLAIAVALGSATQISLFLLPVAVLFGWSIDVPMSLNFLPTFAVAFFASVLIGAIVLMDGRSNWLKGALLLGAYLIFIASLMFNPGDAVQGPVPAPSAAPAPRAHDTLLALQSRFAYPAERLVR